MDGKVVARVALPAGVPQDKIKHWAYTGARGQRGSHCLFRMAGGRGVFETTRPFRPRENLTIDLSFPKGFVHEPSGWEKIGIVLADNIAVAVGLAGLVLVMAYYLVVWLTVGRDPAKGVIIPLLQPPDGLSPAAVRFVRRMGFDNKCASAAIVSLAVKGYLKIIEDDDGEFKLRRSEEFDTDSLTPDELALGKKLLGSRKTLKLAQSKHAIFRRAIKALKQKLRKKHQKPNFTRNTAYVVAGAALSALTIVAAGLSGFLTQSGANPAALFIMVWLAGWSVGVYALLLRAIGSWRDVVRSPKAGKVAGGLVGALAASLFALPFVVFEFVAVGMLAVAGTVWLVLIVLALVVANVRFFHYMKQPTAGGQRCMDAIDGFRMYLATAERDALGTAHPPHKTPELFEKYLPYALAMDVENEWAEQFSDVLAEAGQAAGCQSTWFVSASLTAGAASAVASSLGSSFAGALSSASTSPRSSGSGGGGSSGGGGGGGGGGGW